MKLKLREQKGNHDEAVKCRFFSLSKPIISNPNHPYGTFQNY